MGSILTRRRKNGSLGYTAIIRLKRDGKTLVSESATFDRRQLANEWMRRREAELDQHVTERLAAVELFVEGDAQLVFADEAGGEQGLADGQGRVHGWRSVEVEAGSGLAPAGNSSGRSGMCGKLRCPGEGALVRKSSSGRCAA